MVAYHYTSRFNELNPDASRPVLAWSYGYFGVHLFFIISGFVIFMSVDRSPRVRDFALSRFIRLYPLYWVCVLATWAIVSVFGPHDRAVSVGTMLVNLTMFQSWFGVADVDGVYWTLAVEMSFYLLVAVGMAAGALRGRRLVLSLAGWLLLSVVLRSGVLAAVLPGHDYLQIHLAASYSHLFVAGICFYIGRRDGHSAWTLTGLGAAVGVAFLGGGLRECLITCGLLTLFAAALRGWLRPLAWRPLQVLGFASYALYLIHQNVGYTALTALQGDLGLRTSWTAPLVMVGAVVVALGLTYGWDQPARSALRDQARRLPVFSRRTPDAVR